MDSPHGISRERLEQALEHSASAKLLGAELLDFAPGKVSLQLHSRPELCQHHGYIHGAVIGFMIDSGFTGGRRGHQRIQDQPARPSPRRKADLPQRSDQGRQAPGGLSRRCVCRQPGAGEDSRHRLGDHCPGLNPHAQTAGVSPDAAPGNDWAPC